MCRAVCPIQEGSEQPKESTDEDSAMRASRIDGNALQDLSGE